MGAIVRTCSQNRKDDEIKKDIAFLVETWSAIIEKEKVSKTGAKIYQDIPIPFQVIRDHLDNDIEQVLIDNSEKQTELVHYVKKIAPEYSNRIQLYTGKTPLFEQYAIEEQIVHALDKKVDLKS